jgi:hypothetical protein
MLKEKDVAVDAPIKTISGANPEGAVDVEIMRIVKEKHFVSDGLMMLTLFATELLMTLIKRKEWRCDFGVCCRVV